MSWLAKFVLVAPVFAVMAAVQARADEKKQNILATSPPQDELSAFMGEPQFAMQQLYGGLGERNRGGR